MVYEEKVLVYVLEKKWFYTTELQRSPKHLPRGTQKPEGVDLVKGPRLFSRRFPIKMIFLGVVTQPLPKLGFEGRLLLRRIPEKRVRKKTTYNQSFSDNSILKSELTAKNLG